MNSLMCIIVCVYVCRESWAICPYIFICLLLSTALMLNSKVELTHVMPFKWDCIQTLLFPFEILRWHFSIQFFSDNGSYVMQDYALFSFQFETSWIWIFIFMMTKYNITIIKVCIKLVMRWQCLIDIINLRKVSRNEWIKPRKENNKRDSVVKNVFCTSSDKNTWR